MEYNIDILVAGCNTTCRHCYVNGGKENHNKIVNHGEGMDSIVAASKMFKAAGFRVNISLMLSKLFCADLQEVSELLEVIPYDYLLPVIPDYFPTPRLERYQEIRCNDSEYNEIISFLDARNVDTTDIKSAIKQFNEKSVLSQISTDSLQKLLCEKETAFFHIDNKLDFYIGNTGVALSYCGNLRERTSEDIIDWITSSKDNYYETASIHYEDILSAVRENKMRCSKENYVYPNMIAALLAMMNNTN